MQKDFVKTPVFTFLVCVFYFWFLTFNFLTFLPAAFAEVSWWNKAWKCRKVVKTTSVPSRKGYSPNTAQVSFSNGGYIKEDASDIRVVDKANRSLPYRVIYSRPYHYTTIVFPARNVEEQYYIYFGNPQAKKLKHNWDFQAGLVLETRKKGKGSANNWWQMKKLMENSSEVYGRGFQDQIFLGYNPYGADDYYISIYEGYIYCPEEGKYGFATVSDDASFLFIDGKMVAQWPGYHGVSGGRRAQHRGEIRLKKGIHKIAYYHLEGGGAQVCEAAWKKPSAKYYEVISPSAYLSLIKGKVIGYKKQDNPYPADFFFQEQDNLWFDNQTFTRVKFFENTACRGSSGECEWDFGDGITVVGYSSPEHIYLQPKEYRVRLKTAVPVFLCNYEGKKIMISAKEVGFFLEKDIIKKDLLTDRAQRVIKVQEVVPTNHQQNINQMKETYQKILATYEFKKLPQEALLALLRYYQHTENSPFQAKVYLALLTKNPLSSSWYRYSLELGALYEKNNQYEEAEAVYNRIIREGKDKNRIAEIYLKKARICIRNLGKLNQAENTLLKLLKTHSSSTQIKRSAYVALTDVYKKKGEFKTAQNYCELARKDNSSPLGEGTHLQRIEGFIRTKEYDRALEELEKLETAYPKYKLGYGAYLRATCLYHKGKKKEALEELEFLQKYKKDVVYIGKVDTLVGLIREEKR